MSRSEPSLDDPHDEWCRRHRWRSPKRGGRRNCPECKAEKVIGLATRECLRILEGFCHLTRAPTPAERQLGYDELGRAGYFERKR